MDAVVVGGQQLFVAGDVEQAGRCFADRHFLVGINAAAGEEDVVVRIVEIQLVIIGKVAVSVDHEVHDAVKLLREQTGQEFAVLYVSLDAGNRVAAGRFVVEGDGGDAAAHVGQIRHQILSHRAGRTQNQYLFHDAFPPDP